MTPVTLAAEIPLAPVCTDKGIARGDAHLQHLAFALSNIWEIKSSSLDSTRTRIGSRELIRVCDHYREDIFVKRSSSLSSATCAIGSGDLYPMTAAS